MKTLILSLITLFSFSFATGQTFENSNKDFPIQSLTISPINEEEYLITARFFEFEGMQSTETVIKNDTSNFVYFVYGPQDEIDHDFFITIEEDNIKVWYNDIKLYTTCKKVSNKTEKIWKVTEVFKNRKGRTQTIISYMTKQETKKLKQKYITGIERHRK